MGDTTVPPSLSLTINNAVCAENMRVRFLLVCVFFSIVARCQSDLILQDGGSVNHCLPWQYRSNPLGKCECDPSLQSIVLCRSEPYDLQLHACYCMTQTYKEELIIVGSCQYTCNRSHNGYYFDITANTSSEINMLMCERYNRQGQLCGSCMPGYAPPVYSYYLSCVNCTTNNWAKYMAVSLLPVTAFFVLVITLRISATSPKLNGLILCLQLVFSPSNQRSFSTSQGSHELIRLLLTSLYGIWNLDFLRFVYTTRSGSCQYTCRKSENVYHFDITANTSSEIDMLMCESYNRQGQLCGSCMPVLHQSTPIALQQMCCCFNVNH